MKALGLIVEYNPFHNGHLYHLEESKQKSGADAVIAVMSGQFTQRGEPAIADKWRRAQIALDLGVDLVVELPYAYGVQHAEIFARGAVSILSHLQADYLIFGSESGDISELKRIEALTSSESFQFQLKKHLNAGLSLPRAQALAMEGSASVQQPNNTLGIHYLRAIKEQGSKLFADTIARVHSNYSETSPQHESIASATAIRKLLDANEPVGSYLPKQSLEQLAPQGTVLSWEPYFCCLRQKILTLGTDGLREIHDMKEGLENRFYEGALKANDFEELLAFIKSKRYTRTRIQRICAHILTGTSSNFIKNLDLGQPAPYIRLLGMSATGKLYLNRVKKQVEVPIYSKFSAAGHPMLKHEQKVTAAYGFALEPLEWTRLNADEFSRFPILNEQRHSPKAKDGV